MSVAWVGVAASVGVGLYSSSKQSEANDASLDWSKQMYAQGVNYFEGQQAVNDQMWMQGIASLGSPLPQLTGSYADVSFASASSASASLATAAQAESYDMKAFKAEAYRVEMEGFLQSFKEASDSTDLSLDTFNRRYGQIMDNLEQAVLDVERERFAAQGREQLMVDADTMKSNLHNSIAKAGLTRSGITMEAEKRLQMEVSQQARAIDVNSYAQSGQLQAQTVNALGGLTALRENIASRGEAVALGKGQGMLAAAQQNSAQKTAVSQQWASLQTQASSQNAQNKTNVSLANAQMKTNVSMHNSSMLTNVSMANAQNATQVSMFNAGAANQNSQFNAGVDNSVNMFNTGNAINQQNALSAAYLGRAQSGYNAQNSFYSGVASSGASGVSTAYNNQATQYGQSATAWGQAAGYFYGQASGGTSPYQYYMGSQASNAGLV